MPARVKSIPLVDAGFDDDLDNQQVDKTALPTKGDYTLHKLKASFVKTHFEELYPQFQCYKDSKVIYSFFVEAKCAEQPTSGDDAPALTKFVNWVEENADVEAMEKCLGRCLGVIARWCQQMEMCKGMFTTPA